MPWNRDLGKFLLPLNGWVQFDGNLLIEAIIYWAGMKYAWVTSSINWCLTSTRDFAQIFNGFTSCYNVGRWWIYKKKNETRRTELLKFVYRREYHVWGCGFPSWIPNLVQPWPFSAAKWINSISVYQISWIVPRVKRVWPENGGDIMVK